MGDVREVLLIEQAQRLGKLWAWLPLSALVALVLMLTQDKLPSCVDLKASNGKDVIEVCTAEYQATRNPLALRVLAETLINRGEVKSGRFYALVLVGTSEYVSAWRLLALSSYGSKDYERAKLEVEVSHAAAIAIGDAAKQARASEVLMRILDQQGRYTAGLLASDRCLDEATAAKDTTIGFHCAIAAAAELIGEGAYTLAKHELEKAERLALFAAEAPGYVQLQLALMKANLAQEETSGLPLNPHDGIAIKEFYRAFALGVVQHEIKIQINICQNLAYSLSRQGKFAEARTLLVLAQKIADGTPFAATTRQANVFAMANIEFRSGNLDIAYRIYDSLFEELAPAEKIEAATIQARISLKRDRAEDAERWATLGILISDEARKSESEPEFRPLEISYDRDLYDLLALALHAQSKPVDALLSLLAWNARSEPLTIHASVAPQTVKQLVAYAEKLQAWLPATHPFDKVGALDTLSKIDLLVVTVVDNDVYAIASSHGDVQWNRVGAFADVFDDVGLFMKSPAKSLPALLLGERLLPAAVYQHTSTTLHVMLDGRLSSLAVPALRRSVGCLGGMGMDASPLIALRPVVRVLSLPSSSCRPVPAPGHARALVNAKGDLPESEREIAAIRKAGLEVTAFNGADAKRDAMVSTSAGDLLHLGLHGWVADLGGQLGLADHDMWAIEIAALKLELPLVVLAACLSARSETTDLELDASLASAFRFAGVRRVVATLRPVTDPGAAKFFDEFYANSGPLDPVHALQKAQVALSQTEDEEWPLFTIFGGDLCSTLH